MIELSPSFRARSSCADANGSLGGPGARLALRLFAAAAALFVAVPGSAGEVAGDRFVGEVRPLLERYCYSCHGDGGNEGGVVLDAFADGKAASGDTKLWHAVLRNVRSGIMPPAGEPQPTAEERKLLDDWIKYEAFGISAADPDPGRVTVRRLNRVEYRNTIRDLLGVEYDTAAEFPPDDTGHGFDNIGDVLTLSPLLLEKYLTAATEVVSKAVPTVPKVVPEKVVRGSDFRRADGKEEGDRSVLSYYEHATAAATADIEHDGRYRLLLDVKAQERFVDGMNDYNKALLLFRADGEELLRREFVRQDGKSFRFEFDREWKAGPHAFEIEVQPLTPDGQQVRSLSFRIESVTVQSPSDERHWVRPSGYEKYFPSDPPQDPAGRRAYARELLGRFAAKAFRRPVDEPTKDRLTDLAESVWAETGGTFEAGVARGMVAVLASPRFLFREESVELDSAERFPPVDEYALASRLSYFLWSSMPDDELIRLAGEGKLRENLPGQVDRMLADRRADAFFRHFVGQWLQARDIESVQINARAVLAGDQPRDPEAERRRDRFRELVSKPSEELTDAEKEEIRTIRESFGGSFRRSREFELNGELRRAMQRETEILFEHVVREDRGLVELLDADYTFLNARLAKHYGIEGVEGDEMRRVDLPADSPRGGVLTQGTVLAVTSNPDRTSPVKRGLFILENVLGSPPAPPPPNIPSLEEAGKRITDRTPTLRETLELHRSDPSCASCHARMDPLGLALENFNALGRWRDQEQAGAIDASGTLLTGEPFRDVSELKRILVEHRREQFYHCLTEKLLTYALGRGLEPQDVEAVDRIVERIEEEGGHASALIAGVIESAPFQKRRRDVPDEESADQVTGTPTEPTREGSEHVPSS